MTNRSFSLRIVTITAVIVSSLLLLSSCTWTTLRPHIIASSILDLKAKGLPLESEQFNQKMEQITGSRRHPHNQLMLLKNGEEIFPMMLALIETAQESIFIDQYAFQDDETGNKIAIALKKKAQEEVEIRIVYDSVGSRKTRRSFWKDLETHRIKVRSFNPIYWWTIIRSNNRNHRKSIIVDREIGLIGDFGIGNQYNGDGISDGSWRASALLIRGPAVTDLVNVFYESWEESGMGIIKKDLPIPVIGTRWHAPFSLFIKSEFDLGTTPPDPHDATGTSVRVMSSTPNWGSTEILDVFLLALQSAKHTIHITQSYFIPNSRVRNALIDASRRGVQVQIIIPENSDVRLTKSAGEIFYQELLVEGIRIFERQGTMLHIKAMVIDGVWSTLGSANMDDRSFLINYECNVTVSDRYFGEMMEGMFAEDLMDSREITLKNWKNRPWWKRLKTTLLTPIIKQL